MIKGYTWRKLPLVTASLSLSIVLSGCAPTKGLFDSFGKAVDAASSGLAGDAALTERIAYESKLSDASKNFLIKRPARVPEVKYQCTTNADKEAAIAQARIKTFEAIELYTKGLGVVFTNKIDFSVYAGYVTQAIDGIESTGVASIWPQSAAALTAYKNFGKPVLALAAKLLNMVEDEAIAREVAQTAHKVDPWVQLAIGQMAEGLSTFNDNYMAEINNFAMCEQERLTVIYADRSVDAKEMSDAFNDYYAKLNDIKKSLGIRPDTAKLLKRVAVAHHELANPKANLQMTIDNVKALASAVSDFRTAIGGQSKAI